MKDCAILDSSQSNNASWKPIKEILQTKEVITKIKYQKFAWTKISSADVEAL
jgi:hypothetical protein